LFDDFHGIFGLAKIDGYTATAWMVLDHFDVISGTVDARAPANFIPFPYDWRLSNRLAARRLKDLVDDRLPLCALCQQPLARPRRIYAPSQRQLLRPRPDEELTRRVVAVWARELCERTLDLVPGLLLFGVAESNHQLTQGKRPPRVLHGLA
jgi:hypothetical protein